MLALLVVGAVIGTLVGGRLTDMLVARYLEARVWCPPFATWARRAAAAGFISTSLTPALWFDVAGAALILAANPRLDAARLDVMPSGLWGRAQSARTFLRSLAQAPAPLLSAALQLVAGISPAQAPLAPTPA